MKILCKAGVYNYAEIVERECINFRKRGHTSMEILYKTGDMNLEQTVLQNPQSFIPDESTSHKFVDSAKERKKTSKEEKHYQVENYNKHTVWMSKYISFSVDPVSIVLQYCQFHLLNKVFNFTIFGNFFNMILFGIHGGGKMTQLQG